MHIFNVTYPMLAKNIGVRKFRIALITLNQQLHDKADEIFLL